MLRILGLLLLAEAVNNVAQPQPVMPTEFAAWFDVAIRQGPTAVIAFYLLFKLGPKTDAQTRATERLRRTLNLVCLGLRHFDADIKEQLKQIEDEAGPDQKRTDDDI